MKKIGIWLVAINETLILFNYYSCVTNDYINEFNKVCSLTKLNYGLLYFGGYHLFTIIGIILIYFSTKKKKMISKETEKIHEEKVFEDYDDEDLIDAGFEKQ